MTALSASASLISWRQSLACPCLKDSSCSTRNPSPNAWRRSIPIYDDSGGNIVLAFPCVGKTNGFPISSPSAWSSWNCRAVSSSTSWSQSSPRNCVADATNPSNWDCSRSRRCRGGLGVAAASGEARSTQGLLEVWQSSQGLGRLEELGRVVVVQSLQDWAQRCTLKRRLLLSKLSTSLHS